SASLRGSSATPAIIGTRVQATICLPTYNERENLEPMLGALRGVLRLGDRVAADLGFVEVLHRERKEGLGPAYLAGFRHALAGGAELVLEMDCDFSHDPADVPRLIAAVEGGADVALGSRYTAGGGVRNWGLLRRVISRGASFYTGLFLHMR